MNGLTVAGGNANGAGGSTISVNGTSIRQNSGGGMCNYNSSPTAKQF